MSRLSEIKMFTAICNFAVWNASISLSNASSVTKQSIYFVFFFVCYSNQTEVKKTANTSVIVHFVLDRRTNIICVFSGKRIP